MLFFFILSVQLLVASGCMASSIILKRQMGSRMLVTLLAQFCARVVFVLFFVMSTNSSVLVTTDGDAVDSSTSIH